MVQPPAAITGFSAQADDLAVILSWSAPPQGQLVEVQRRRAGEPKFTTLDPERDGRLDLEVAYENEYLYRARLVIPQGRTRVPGPWSQEITVRVEDRIPPAPPEFLDAAITSEGVRLAWRDRSESSNVTGFYLYRAIVTPRDQPAGQAASGQAASGQAEAGQANFVRIGGLMTTNHYLDTNVPPDSDVRYRLTAVDDSPRKNESGPSPEVTVYFAPASEAEPQEKPVFEDPGL
jgi:hypothetical protein